MMELLFPCVISGEMLRRLGPMILAVGLGPIDAPDRRGHAPVVTTSASGSSARPRPITPTSFRIDLGVVATGSLTRFELVFRNDSKGPVKILGGQTSCSAQGCFTIEGRYPVTVPAGAEGHVPIVFKAAPQLLPGAKPEIRIESAFYLGTESTVPVPYSIVGAIARD